MQVPITVYKIIFMCANAVSENENVFSIGVDYGTSVLTLCFLSHFRVHYCYIIPVKYA